MTLRQRALAVGEFFKEHEKNLKISFETIKLLKEFVDEPSIITAGQLLLGGLHAYAEAKKSYWAGEEFSNRQEWQQACGRGITHAVTEALSGFPRVAISAGEKSTTAYLINVKGHDVGVLSRGSGMDDIFLRRKTYAEAKKIISELVVNHLKGNIVVSECVDGWTHWFEAKPDDEIEAYHTLTTVNYAKELKKYLDLSINRTVMFYGPPGTGKSTYVRSIVDYLGFKSLRFRTAEMSGLTLAVVHDIIEVIQPKVVLIDDFDRIRDQTILLEMLEYLNRKVPLVLLTVNKTDFDLGVKRPQRVDLMEEVLTLEPDVVRKLLGEGNQQYFETIRNWPVSFVMEFSRRLRVQKDSKRIAKSLKELDARQKEAPPPPDPPKKKTTAKKKKGSPPAPPKAA